MIEIDNLTKYYGERRAVGPLSCTIEEGEIVGLLGLNGAGKTTTLRILACDLLPSSGSVRIDGLDVVDHPDDVRAMVGYLPDTPPLYGEMTVRAYLQFAARLRGVSRADTDRRVTEALSVTHLSAVADDPIRSLSHGFRQRVGIAQAVVHKPRLLVLDEPITGLDPAQIVEMRELLKSLRGEHTIVLSSHILAEISETCDRILVMRAGEIGAAGTEAELHASLLRGVRATFTIRGDADLAAETMIAVDGVTAVAPADATEPGDGVAAFVVEADRDVREGICKALVGAGVGILGVKRAGNELESVFLELAAPVPAGAAKRASPKASHAQKNKPEAVS